MGFPARKCGAQCALLTLTFGLLLVCTEPACAIIENIGVPNLTLRSDGRHERGDGFLNYRRSSSLRGGRSWVLNGGRFSGDYEIGRQCDLISGGARQYVAEGTCVRDSESLVSNATVDDIELITIKNSLTYPQLRIAMGRIQIPASSAVGSENVSPVNWLKIGARGVRCNFNFSWK